jgi:transcriptional regulator with XRE-family HTH domain
MSQRIHDARSKRGMGLRELARSAEVSPGYLTKIERGEANPTFAVIQRLATALDTEPSSLVAMDDGVERSSASVGRDFDRLLRAYRRLEPRQRRLVLGVAEELASGHTLPREQRTVQLGSGSQLALEASSPTHYVHGWRRETFEYNRHNSRLVHVAGEQFGRLVDPISRGDVIWVVSILSGALRLHGHMTVASRSDLLPGDPHPSATIFTQREAERLLNAPDLWSASEHLLSPQLDGGARLADLAVDDAAVRGLRFRQGSGRLTDVAFDRRGGVSPQAFRSVRVLTPESAATLERVWKAHAGPVVHRSKS